MSNNVDDYIQQGIHGPKEIKAEERLLFLGTIRERVVIALTTKQVRQAGICQQTVQAMKQNKEARLYLNGHIQYSVLSKYVKIATTNDIDYTIVTNQEHHSDLGLVLAYSYAIDKENIYVETETSKSITKSKKRRKIKILKIFNT